MPRPGGFLASLTDKAQSAINASPLAGHIPSSVSGTGAPPRPSSPGNANQPSANQAAAQGGAKSHTLDALQHQLRTFKQEYSTTSPMQKIITTEKGLAISYDCISRDAKTQSKELYTWGQSESDDLRDVTDRLAYLNFIQGSLAAALAVKLDAARAPFKALRDFEAGLIPRRNIRAGMKQQLARVEQQQQSGMEGKIKEMKDQLKKAEQDDEPQEKSLDLLKRKAVRESEQLKWEALREYGEKLALLSQAAAPIIAALPTLPPTAANPYAGAPSTAAVRASLQRTLDNYKPGQSHLDLHPEGVDLSRHDSRSFGETHASELASAQQPQPGIPVTPPTKSSGLPEHQHPAVAPATGYASPPVAGYASPPAAGYASPPAAGYASPPAAGYASPPAAGHTSPPINPAALNQSPAPIPGVAAATSTAGSSTSTALPADHPLPDLPTVAETGVPVAGGPGPASGSLLDLRGASQTAGPKSDGEPGNVHPSPGYGAAGALAAAATTGPKPTYESAEEEKRRLYAGYSQAQPPAPAPGASYTAPSVPPGSGPSYDGPGMPTPAPAPAPHETAEDEKKRLEKERLSRQEGGDNAGQPQGPPGQGNPEDLPPYQG